MKKMLLLILSIFLFAGTANAVYIDFASETFSGADGQTSFSTTYLGIDMTILGNPKDRITWNPGSAGGVDGIGVNDDEISNSEFIYISFANTINVDHVDLTDLFYENGYLEEGSYWIEESSDVWSNQIFFNQTDYSKTSYPESNGEFMLNINQDIVGLRFAGINNASEHDYSIRGLEANAPVPEPATMFLFGTGLIGLAGFRRKFKK